MMFSKAPDSSKLVNSRRRQQIRSDLIPPLNRKQFLERLLNNPNINVLKMQEQQYYQVSPEYSEKPSQFIRWLLNLIQQVKITHSIDSSIDITLSCINSPIPKTHQERYQKITEHILMENNFMLYVLHNGFLYYLFKKYQLFNYTRNDEFKQQFERDVKWFIEYFTENILSLYSSWLERIEREARQYFTIRGMLNILSRCPKWNIIYSIFNKCLGKQKNEKNKKELEQYFNSVILEIKGNEIPFENTIELIRKFCDEYDFAKKINLLKRLDGVMRSEGVEFNQNLSDYENECTKLKCLEYCSLMSGKETMKSIFYLRMLLDLDQMHLKTEVNCFHDANYNLLSGETAHPYPCTKLTLSKIHIEFKLPIIRSLKQSPFTMESVQQNQKFTTLGSSKLTLFSSQSLIPGSQVSILFTEQQNDLTIGVCNKRELCRQRIPLEDSKHAIVFNCHSRLMYERASTTEEASTTQHIYKITLKISESYIIWILNGESRIQNQIEILREYYPIVNNDLNDLYACLTLKNGTSFLVLDF